MNEENGEDEKQALGIIPNEMKPFWTEVPLLLHLYLHGLISATTNMNVPSENIEHYKFSNNTITFSFPGIRHRYELPRIYWGMTLFCSENNKYYTLPTPNNYSNDKTYQATSLDEQIDADFWAQQ